MLAIQYIRSIPRYLWTRHLGPRLPAIYTGKLSVIRLAQAQAPKLPGPQWARIRSRMSGICGSDLATVCAKGSSYFSPLISTPFVLGHEVVGEVVEAGKEIRRAAVGDRVVIEPALGCEVRGFAELCPRCQQGQYAHCENVTAGAIAAGIQTGFCKDTGGGWGEEFVAHDSQIFKAPVELSDEEAVLAEPLSCSLHAALAGRPKDSQTALVIGCGSIGLLLIAALRGLGAKCRILAVAKYPHQRKRAEELGAEETLTPGPELYASLCKSTGSRLYQPELGKPTGIGGVDMTFDCVGSDSSIDDALRFTRAGGRVLLVGMPAIPKSVDWTAIWYKALRVEGVYAYGWEEWDGQRVKTFDLAFRLMVQKKVKLESMVGGRFPLSRYREAIESALWTGRSGSVKTVFVLPG